MEDAQEALVFHCKFVEDAEEDAANHCVFVGDAEEDAKTIAKLWKTLTERRNMI